MSAACGTSPADHPAGVTAAEAEALRRFNEGRLRQELLEFAFRPEPLKAGALTALWLLGCPPPLLLALAGASVGLYAALRRRDRQRRDEAACIAAKRYGPREGRPGEGEEAAPAPPAVGAADPPGQPSGRPAAA